MIVNLQKIIKKIKFNIIKPIKKKKNGPREKLSSILKTTHILIEKSNSNDVRKTPVYSLICALTNYHLYDIVRELYEDEEVTTVHELYKDIGRYITHNQLLDNTKSFEVGESNIYVDLKRDAVLLCAWNKERFLRALYNIGNIVGNKFQYDKLNHFSIYIYPIGLTIIYNGNHSALSGILKGEGSIYPNETYDLTPTYDYMYFDGVYFKKQSDHSILHKVSRFELGALYEIGRLLAENGIK